MLTPAQKYDRSSSRLPILQDRAEPLLRALKEQYGGLLYLYTSSLSWLLPTNTRERLVSRVEQNEVIFIWEEPNKSTKLDWAGVQARVKATLKD